MKHSVSAQNVSHASYAALTTANVKGWAVLATASDLYWSLQSLYPQKAVPFVLALPYSRLLAVGR
jgi:hypothetical protein